MDCGLLKRKIATIFIVVKHTFGKILNTDLFFEMTAFALYVFGTVFWQLANSNIVFIFQYLEKLKYIS